MALPLKNNGWLTVPYAEYVRKDASAGATLSSGWDGEQRATMQILVNWGDGLQAEEDILGVSVFQSEPAPGKLSRTPAVQHPLKPSLRAERILDARPVVWEGKQLVDLPYGPGAGGNSSFVSTYGLWHMTIGFQVPKYTIITDTDLQIAFGGQEWNRYVVVTTKPRLETLVRERGTFIWQEGGAGITGTPFPSPMGTSIYSTMIELIWKRVPRVGLFGQAGESDFLNENILGAIGNVHNGATNLWGLVVGGAGILNANASSSILRLTYAEQIPIPSPFIPTTQGLPWGRPNTYHDVKFLFHVYEPPSTSPGGFQGHNLAPHVNGGWYLVKNQLGGTIYPTSDLTQIFQLALI